VPGTSHALRSDVVAMRTSQSTTHPSIRRLLTNRGRLPAGRPKIDRAGYCATAHDGPLFLGNARAQVQILVKQDDNVGVSNSIQQKTHVIGNCCLVQPWHTALNALAIY
jgi:hypothetical protein